MTDFSHLEIVALVISLEWPAFTEIKRALWEGDLSLCDLAL